MVGTPRARIVRSYPGAKGSYSKKTKDGYFKYFDSDANLTPVNFRRYTYTINDLLRLNFTQKLMNSQNVNSPERM